MCLLHIVDHNVSLQVYRLGETLWFFSSLNLNVIVQVTRETLVTFPAGMWFIHCMDRNVTLQAARSGECFFTFLA